MFRQVLGQDLARSGWFRVVQGGAAAIVVRGTCEEKSGRGLVRCRVENVAEAKAYFDRSFDESPEAARRLAHKVADEIVWAVKRKPGIASTRIAMIGSMPAAIATRII